jgi:hypothetical protein
MCRTMTDPRDDVVEHLTFVPKRQKSFQNHNLRVLLVLVT